MLASEAVWDTYKVSIKPTSLLLGAAQGPILSRVGLSLTLRPNCMYCTHIHIQTSVSLTPPRDNNLKTVKLTNCSISPTLYRYTFIMLHCFIKWTSLEIENVLLWKMFCRISLILQKQEATGKRWTNNVIICTVTLECMLSKHVSGWREESALSSSPTINHHIFFKVFFFQRNVLYLSTEWGQLICCGHSYSNRDAWKAPSQKQKYNGDSVTEMSAYSLVTLPMLTNSKAGKTVSCVLLILNSFHNFKPVIQPLFY